MEPADYRKRIIKTALVVREPPMFSRNKVSGFRAVREA
jgi:hypothetical protein